ncbi:DUF4249 domain-containing protein [Ekhidna sp. MALMAid0563]|uniref:DUF4249 domain-containing protein n=1 Tax=Ekhidna sp. MALMAid0563 TaxID=3143937 RepID=UPI0032DF9CB9
MKNTYTILIIFLFLTYCIEPYTLQELETRRVLVIDALVTNMPEEQFVHLTYSYPIDGTTPEPVSGAKVMITDNLGDSIEFAETEDGFYQPITTFQGIVGRKYQLSIETADGESYQSSEEELLMPASEIDIYGRYLSLLSENSDDVERGVQFLLDIEETGDGNHSYRFSYTEDYEISVPFEARYEYDPSNQTINDRTLSTTKCYITDESSDFLIATTSGQINGNLSEFPVVFISENDFELIGKYSLTVKQYRISSTAYQYYKDLQENNESAGSFFDKQKGQLNGNIRNLDNSSEPVVGYFEVSSVSEKYQIFEPGTWKEEGYGAPKIFLFCVDLLDTVSTAEILAGNISFDRRLLYDFVSCEVPLPGTNWCPQALLIPETCSDCRVYGSLDQPTFWD